MRNNGLGILFGGLGIAGFGAGVFFAAKETPAAKADYEERKERYGGKVPPKDILKIGLKNYKKTIISCVIGAGCIAAGIGVSAATQASLMASYGVLDGLYKKYRSKNIELNGIECDRKIREMICVDEVKKAEAVKISAPTFGDLYTILPDDYDEGEGEILFHLPYYDSDGKGLYFTSTVPRVMDAVYHFCRNMFLSYSESGLDSLIELLGLEPTKFSENQDWNYLYDDGIWLDISIGKKVQIDDNMFCRPIFFAFDPVDKRCEETGLIVNA